MKQFIFYIVFSSLMLVLGACGHDVSGDWDELTNSLNDEGSRSFICTIQTHQVGELEYVLDEACSKQGTAKELLTELSIEGPLNSDDLDVIKPLMFLRKLDLSKVTVCELDGKVTHEFPYGGLQSFQSEADVILPLSVTSLANSAFINSNIKSVCLPEGLLQIEGDVFSNCKNLQFVNFPSTLKSIGWRAFESCIRLTNVDLPVSLIAIKDFAFQNTGLTDLVIPDSVMEIGRYAFSQNQYLAELKWPLHTHVIPEYCFENCSKLRFDIPGHITKISTAAFEGMSMQQMVIPSSVTSVGDNIFRNCYNLTAVFWNAEAIIPNLFDGGLALVYASREAKANSDVNNIVRGDSISGYEADEIFLTDKLPYNVPVSFKARKVFFTHEFSGKTDVYDCSNWSALSLPFDVSKVYVKENYNQKERVLQPFGSANMSGAKPFWLRKLSTDGFLRATAIEAWVPYLISFPNNSELYLPEYNIEGEVVFCGENVTLPSKEQIRVLKGPDFDMHSNFQNLEMSMDWYNLNKEIFYSKVYNRSYPIGSVFRSYVRTTKPYEAFVTSGIPSRSIIPIPKSAKTRMAGRQFGKLVVPDEYDL